MPPNTAATKHFSPGSDPASGYTDDRGIKYRIDPSPASAQPITNVRLITELILIPISCAVSKSRDTARIAMPTLVLFTSSTSATTSTTVIIGVINVTSVVEMEPI